jgi:hypothetical protein
MGQRGPEGFGLSSLFELLAPDNSMCAPVSCCQPSESHARGASEAMAQGSHSPRKPSSATQSASHRRLASARHAKSCFRRVLPDDTQGAAAKSKVDDAESAPDCSAAGSQAKRPELPVSKEQIARMRQVQAAPATCDSIAVPLPVSSFEASSMTSVPCRSSTISTWIGQARLTPRSWQKVSLAPRPSASAPPRPRSIPACLPSLFVSRMPCANTRAALKKMGLRPTPGMVKKLMTEFDEDKNGTLEVCAGMLDLIPPLPILAVDPLRR